MTLPARRSGAPGAVPPGDAGTYSTLCFSCHRVVMLAPADAVVAEARAIIGDLTIVFCGDCIARMVDGA
jgi:hypothetical protein